MTTLEERAKENANKNGFTDKTWNASVGSYMLGATEQRKIDIDMACKVYCSTCPCYMDGCQGEDKCDKVQYIRQMMEKLL